jgi:hypothetical protein
VSAYVPKRHGRGDWIARAFADTADIRTPLDLLAFLLCGALVALLAWMVWQPREFYLFVTETVVRIAEVLPW